MGILTNQQLKKSFNSFRSLTETRTGERRVENEWTSTFELLLRKLPNAQSIQILQSKSWVEKLSGSVMRPLEAIGLGLQGTTRTFENDTDDYRFLVYTYKYCDIY